ncbi:hypothetical protein SDC9_110912 [bioreactor metagenome]|uniref:Uncharacterized protein n=1 Tax=bioreactor metagenome TaxID=1076179 RepID=A0A645BFW0_9ZZZZ
MAGQVYFHPLHHRQVVAHHLHGGQLFPLAVQQLFLGVEQGNGIAALPRLLR